MKRLCFIVLLLGLMAGIASAGVHWTGGAAGNWNVAANWTDDSNAAVHRVPLDTESADIKGTAVVTVDDLAPAVCNILRLANGAAADNVTLVISDPDSSLTISGSGSAEVFAVGKTGKGVVDQSAGTVTVSNTGGTGEIRINSGTAGSEYKLSGGLLDTQVIRKNNQSSLATGEGFNDTGGTIIIRNSMFRIGPPSASNADMIWTQGASTLKVGGSIGVVGIGQTGYDEKYTTTDGSVIEIELESDASYDLGRSSNTVNFTDGTLNIVALDDYVPAINATFDIWKIDLKAGRSGSGTFDQITDDLPGYFTAKWVDGAGTSDVFRIKYVPEPTTVALLGLGSLIAIRRRKK